MSVETFGRDGYNAVAVNGEWSFWRVKNGRLAFRREVELEVDVSDGEDEELEHRGEAASQSSRGGDSRGTALISVRLFLFYMPQVDMWVISDGPDTTGTVVADCGPVLRDPDLSQHWRVWDGEAWLEDRNVQVEVHLPDPAPVNLRGLTVTPHLPAVAGPLSARSRVKAPPMAAAPQSARVRGGSHPPRL